MSFSYVDLFAGCGGLSLGLESEGGTLIVAVERSPMAAETFFHNLIEKVESPDQWTEYLQQDVSEQTARGLVVKELEKVLFDTESMNALKASQPDVIVGGPPCQGFSLAGRRNPEDSRNSLPWQFLTLVEETQPKIVVIENVVGMRHKFAKDEKDVFEQLQIALAETSPGYVVQAVEVNAVHYGAPQHRPRLMIIGLRSDIAKEMSVKSSGSLWRSDFKDKIAGEIPTLAPVPTINSSEMRTVADAIGDLQAGYKTASKSVREYSENWGVLRASAIQRPLNHVIRAHQPKSTKRFRLYQWLDSVGIESKFLSNYTVATQAEKSALFQRLENQAKLPAKAPDGTILAKTWEELTKVLEEVQTKKHSQRVLKLNEPSRTVVTIGDDYVHPFEPRTFTVRELARFQGFPDAFEFRAKETTGGLNRRNEVPQYSQVGNAVSPFLAKAVGKMIRQLLG
jgi:DNA (cytosine-5)-methyltransferase 1